MNNIIEQKTELTKKEFRTMITEAERKMRQTEGVKVDKDTEEICPLKHSFGDGVYAREMTMLAGTMIISKIHKKKHPYFVMKGKALVSTEGGIIEIEAPYQGMTLPGTKRAIYAIEDIIWTTVHGTEKTDLDEIEDEIIAKDFKEFDKYIFIEHFKKMTKRVIAAEKDGFYSDWTSEQQKLFDAEEWVAFSRSRGYTEEEISEYKKWMDIVKKDNKILMEVEDLIHGAIMVNIKKDKNGEIIKSSYCPLVGFVKEV